MSTFDKENSLHEGIEQPHGAGKKEWKTPKMSEISIVEETRSSIKSGTDGWTSPLPA